VPEQEREALRRWMRRAVQASGLSANRLAKAAGVNQSTLTRFMGGYANYAPSRETIEKIAEAAGVDPPRLGALEAGELELLTGSDEYRDLIREAVRLAGRVVRDEVLVSSTSSDQNVRVQMDRLREVWLPDLTLKILDTLVNLKKAGALNASAILAIEASFKHIAFDMWKTVGVEHPLSPFRNMPRWQDDPDPQPEDSPPDNPPEPEKKAMQEDDGQEHKIVA